MAHLHFLFIRLWVYIILVCLYYANRSISILHGTNTAINSAGGFNIDGFLKNMNFQLDGIPVISNKTKLSLAVVSWNLNERRPKSKDTKFLTSIAESSDVVVIGVQECENIKFRSSEGSRSRAWRRLQSLALGSDFELIADQVMGGMQIALFSRSNVTSFIGSVQTLGIPCGIGNFIANKGATCIIVSLLNQSIAFINTHLAAHDKKVEARNGDVKRIVSEIKNLLIDSFLKDSQKTCQDCNHRSRNASPKTKKRLHSSKWVKPRRAADGTSDSMLPLDGAIFFGDLNYRLDLSRQKALQLLRLAVNTSDYSPLLKFDQLNKLMAKKKILNGFYEPRVGFRPTFKYDLHSDEYDTSSKRRCPAWTDRILYQASNDLGIIAHSYTSIQACRHSDHRPVVGIFSLFFTNE